MSGKQATISVGVIENSRGELLIARETEAGPWCFPQIVVPAGLSAEAALRRVARELGLRITIHTVQPPVQRETAQGSQTYRYHICRAGGAGTNGPYAETRWVLKGQLREYEFTGQDQEVVEWILGD
ncbi:MAG: NUDIX domain-containing protein [Phycisphaerales bacterium]|nr:MAG: NUDIX domain-containing protein [Phycisphaerales bacterium]